ncbi:hypothetical protein [Endothiovibrio diazotrophicus]
MSQIPDFTDAEKWIVSTTLKERYREEVPFDEVVTEMRLNPMSSEMAECPAVYWERDTCHFIIVKVAEGRYRAQFFYRIHRPYGTGIEEFDDLTECAVTLLQVQADHTAREREAEEKAAGAP